MKILQVTPRYPPHVGGVETHVCQIAERLVKRGHDVTVHTADRENDISKRETRNGVRVVRHRGVSPGGAFHIAPGIAWAVNQANADVVHAHNYHSLPLLFASVGVDDGRFVVTPHYHGGSADSLRDRLLSVYRPLGGWALDRADDVVAVSGWERQQLMSDFDVDSTVIPNGINVERFKGADPEIRDQPYLLCVGRLEAYKGVQHAVRALSHLPDRELIVAGSGPFHDELEAVAEEAGVSDRVSLLGYVDEERLPGLYAGADVVLSLSNFEAFGITVGEALAAGTPCVVYKSGALADWTSNQGCIGIERRTPKHVAQAVREAAPLTPDKVGLWEWNDVVDVLLNHYRGE